MWILHGLLLLVQNDKQLEHYKCCYPSNYLWGFTGLFVNATIVNDDKSQLWVMSPKLLNAQ